MRLRYVLPFVAALAVAGCNGQPSKKPSETARAPISTAAPVNCPVAPACPTAKAAAATSGAHRARKVKHHRVRSQPAHRVATSYRRHHTRRDEGLAGGPVRIYRGRDQEERSGMGGAYDDSYGFDDSYGYEAAPRYHYGPVEPQDPDRYYRPRQPEAANPGGSGYYYRRHGEERRDRYGAGSAPPPPTFDGDEGGRAYAEERDMRRDQHASSGYRARRSFSESRSMRSEEHSSSSSSYSEQRSSSAGPCCHGSGAGAAGFDGFGYLTWPGKIPARP